MTHIWRHGIDSGKQAENPFAIPWETDKTYIDRCYTKKDEQKEEWFRV